MLIRRDALSLCGTLVRLVLSLTAVLQVHAKETTSTPHQLKFEVYKDTSNEYRWRLVEGVDKESKVLATGGQGYKAKDDCLHGVKIFQEDAKKLKYEVYQDKASEYRWRAKSSNGQIVGTSGSAYKSKADCEKALDDVKNGGADATVEQVKESKP
jgi:uncharacterized protein YegP (UPF0339 family)